MAANTTRDTGKSAGGPDTTETVAQLDQLLDRLEAIAWRDVDGLTTAEAAAIAERVADARDATADRELATDGGRDTLAGLDAIVHDPTQATLGSFSRGARGPYPAHPFGGVRHE
jgi:hypothetical protein